MFGAICRGELNNCPLVVDVFHWLFEVERMELNSMERSEICVWSNQRIE